MFDNVNFEIDETGTPYWICPRIEKTIGLFGGTDVHGAVLVNAVTGESAYYEEVPACVDALALGADEGRDEHRYASGSCKQALIRRFPNGETHHS